jgi:peptidoglycan hydrolase-like protein with peptidoglycan-binding domain
MSIYKKTANAVLIALLCGAMFSSFVMPTRAQSNTGQSEQIKMLLAMIEQLQAELAQMQGGNTGQCIQLSRSLFLGVSDSETAGEVTKLQQFLTKTGHYTYGKPTGYFGPATQVAVQAWQKANGVVSSGSPETTGYGVTGPTTRGAMARGCVSTNTTTSTNKPVVEESESSSVTITSISNSENPLVKGTATNVDAVGFSVSNGDKVYGSGDINVEDGVWSHKITKDLEDGKYTLIVYVENSKVAQKVFTVGNTIESGSITSDDTTYLLSPRLKGTAKNVDAVRISYQSEETGYDGNYISNPIRVVNGKWSHTVTHTSKAGAYNITLLDNSYTTVNSDNEIEVTDEDRAILDEQTLTIYSSPSVVNFELDFSGNLGQTGYFSWQADNASYCDVYQTLPNGKKEYVAESKDPDMGSYESKIELEMYGELQYTLECYGQEAGDGTQPIVEKTLRNIGYKG